MDKIEVFGSKLLDTGDLDPVYIALHSLSLSGLPLAKWLVTYWCFYHSGVACHAVEANDYWGVMEAAAANDDQERRWPRGTERRHFRGLTSKRAVAELRSRFGDAEGILSYVTEDGSLDGVVRRVTGLYGFGRWIAFKVADMLDRCAGVEIAFDEAGVFLYEQPAESVDILWRRRRMPPGIDQAVKRSIICRNLLAEFDGRMAPPTYDRPLGMAEIETILCKWKSHINGRYHIGKDCNEVREHLRGWGSLAERMALGVPGCTTL